MHWDEISLEDGLYFRQTLFDQARRVVVKVGSAVLTNPFGLDLDVIDNLARELAFLVQGGRELVLVTSGAVAAGRRRLGVERKPNTPLQEKQALAAVGQGLLMQAYEQVFSRLQQPVAQVLLTHADFAARDRYLNIRNTFQSLFEFGALPIVNENDTVAVEELNFGDNDTLGALVTNLIEADMFIILTDVPALYTGNPVGDPTARPVYTVPRIDAEVEAMAGNVRSSVGTGGMQSKIRAAKMVAVRGGSSFIGPGKVPDILKRLFSGELLGTFFLPHQERIRSRQHWIAYTLRPNGFLLLDDGACRALLQGGKSLLPSGIVEVRGRFNAGAAVHCLDAAGRAIAAGLSNYSSDDVNRIKGLRSQRIAQVLGRSAGDEVIHRDNLVLLERGPGARSKMLEEINGKA
ncbi:MAG: glutamate 5-kinase [Desulfobulbaceae bacterium A2]|nr:MAG: glutamate 5-kinase [Desulfobulbaceae bacterium A2]